MNIWILNHYAKPIVGRHFKFAKNLIENENNVKVFAASTVHGNNENRINNNENYLHEIYNNVPFVFVRATNYNGNERRRYKNMLDYAFRLLKVSKKFDEPKPDVIYASSVHPLTWLSGYILAKRYKTKFIVETRDLWPETLIAMRKIKKSGVVAKLMYRLEKFIYTKADALVFTMEGGKDYLFNRGIKRKNVYHINNGVDLEEFERNEIEYYFNDEELDDNNNFKVIYTGSMGAANSIGDILEAAKEIQNQGHRNIKFLLFGDGYLKQKHEKYVADNDLHNVSFKGKVEKKFIPSILKRSDLNIFTGEYTYLYKYGISLNKMFDYFASGKPVVSNLKCSYDLIDRYQCGFTIESSIEELVSSILYVKELSVAEYNKLCNNAMMAAKDYDYKNLTNKLESIIINSSN